MTWAHTPENPAAFPLPDHYSHDGIALSEGSRGMTLRDYFAGQALAPVMSTAQNLGASTHADRAEQFGMIAGWMYEMADAMLAARATSKEASHD